MITYVEDQVRVRSHVGGHRDVAIRQSMSGRQHGTCNDPLPCVCILRITWKMEFNKNGIKKVVNLMSIHLIPIYISSVVCDYHLHIFITTSIEIPIMEWPCWIISIMIMWQVYCEPFGKQCLLFNGIDNLDHTWILALWKHYLYASLEIHVFYNYCSSSLSDAWSYTSIQFTDSV